MRSWLYVFWHMLLSAPHALLTSSGLERWDDMPLRISAMPPCLPTISFTRQLLNARLHKRSHTASCFVSRIGSEGGVERRSFGTLMGDAVGYGIPHGRGWFRGVVLSHLSYLGARQGVWSKTILQAISVSVLTTPRTEKIDYFLPGLVVL